MFCIAKQKALRLQERIAEAFENEPGETYEILVTEQPKDAERLARREAETGDAVRVYACGGDGTLMETASGRVGYPNAQLAFLTPAHCCRPIGSDKDPSPRPMKRPDAQPLVFYVETIERTAKELGIPVFNMFENLGLDPNNEEIREKYTVDGLHFNDDGHAIIAEKVKAFLESI